MKNWFVLSICICFVSVSFAQEKFRLLKTVTWKEDIVHAAIDRVGELYLTDRANKISRIDVNGKTIASAQLKARPDIFDPRDGSHVFLYWRNNQRFELRLSDLTTTSTSKVIDSAFAVSPYLACPSGDHDILVLDSADWSLKKVSGTHDRVIFETIILPGGVRSSDLVWMREYQNFVFVQDKSVGLRIFNRMGKHLKTLDTHDASYFNFLGVELYYPSGTNTLQFFDLFTTEERVVQLPSEFQFALLSDERLFIVKARELSIYSVE